MNTVISFLLLLTTAYSFVVVDQSANDGCDDDSFPCDSGRCVPKWYWCDTAIDCEDGSDENYCSTATLLNPDPNNCTSKHFRCANGKCIPKKGVCDGENSCRDNSDEILCEPTSTTNLNTEVLTHEPELKDVMTYSAFPDHHDTVHEMTETTHSELLASNLPDAVSVDLPNELNDEVHKSSSTNHPDPPKTSTHSDPPKTSTAATNKRDHFTELKLSTYKEELHNALEWLMSVRDKDLSWGDYTSRALTAICLANPSFMDKDNDAMLMVKQLHLQLALALIRNDTKLMPLSDLSLYVNALMATCSNPRNFHGMDLIAVLRHRTDAAQIAEFVSPSVYLTLCLANSSSHEDVVKLEEIFYGKSPSMDKIDIKALATLAALCMSKTPEWSDYAIIKQSSKLFLQKMTSNGLPENIYELSLLVQAFNEARIPENLWERIKAMRMILNQRMANGSFGDILSTYYVLPILSGRSLASTGRLCGVKNTEFPELIPLEVLKNTKRNKIFVRYTLRFGDPVEVTRSLQLKVPQGTSFFDIMRLAADIDWNFRFMYSIIRGQPVIHSIGNKANDAEKGMYWVLYVSSASNAYSNPVAYTGDLRQYYPGEENDSVFWLKALSVS